MLFETIHKVQERPLPERRRIAFWTAFLLTLFIVLIWGLTLLIRSSQSSPDTQKQEAPSPFENMWDGVREGFESFKEYLPKEGTE